MSQSASVTRWSNVQAEFQAMGRLFRGQFAPVRARGQLGRGRPVLVLPGYMFGDFSTGLLRRTLKACGFRTYAWQQGINLNEAQALPRLLDRVDEIHQKSGMRVALVGWSLGGLYARELARLRPDKVSVVITLGTPFSAGERVKSAWSAELRENGIAPPAPSWLGAKPKVPTIAVWSRQDTIVSPDNASGQRHGVEQGIEVHCRHTEFLSDPESVRAVIGALSTAA
jgi:hypothetical protein